LLLIYFLNVGVELRGTVFNFFCNNRISTATEMISRCETADSSAYGTTLLHAVATDDMRVRAGSSAALNCLEYSKHSRDLLAAEYSFITLLRMAHRAVVGLREITKRMVEKRYRRSATIKQCKSANNTLRSNAENLTKECRTVYSKNATKTRRKKEGYQRNNLTVLSQLPVARSGAVG
jgi:hypothetical protein